MRSTTLLLLAAAAAAGDAPGHLRQDEHIATIGDSITCQGVYQEYAAELLAALQPGAGIRFTKLLAALQPGAGIRFTNLGVGGATAGHGAGQLGKWLKDPANARPTLVLSMFGVNDTRWQAADSPEKSADYRKGLEKIAAACETQGLPLILLRESHFSKDASENAWSAGLNQALTRLLAVHDAFAAERKLPVVDLHTAYRRALCAAWAVDPRYHFTPDVIHPTLPGHAAMAVELVRALGGWAPLAGEARGALAEADPTLAVEVLPALGFAAPEAAIRSVIRVRNLADRERIANVRWTCGGTAGSASLPLPAFGSAEIPCAIPAAPHPRLWAVPLAVFAEAGAGCTAGHALLWRSRTRDAAAAHVAFGADDFRSLEARPLRRPCPIGDGQVRLDGDRIEVAFTWTDQDTVCAQPGFKNRFGTVIATALDANARDGQPCDAVELFLDLRPEHAAGRYTAEVDALPEGVVRIGVFHDAERKPGLQVAGLPAEAVRLDVAGDRWRLAIAPGHWRGRTIGFDLRVTDNAEFKLESTPVHHLTGRPLCSPEPMAWLRFGRQDHGVQYRLGY